MILLGKESVRGVIMCSIFFFRPPSPDSRSLFHRSKLTVRRIQALCTHATKKCIPTRIFFALVTVLSYYSPPARAAIFPPVLNFARALSFNFILESFESCFLVSLPSPCSPYSVPLLSCPHPSPHNPPLLNPLPSIRSSLSTKFTIPKSLPTANSSPTPSPSTPSRTTNPKLASGCSLPPAATPSLSPPKAPPPNIPAGLPTANSSPSSP